MANCVNGKIHKSIFDATAKPLCSTSHCAAQATVQHKPLCTTSQQYDCAKVPPPLSMAPLGSTNPEDHAMTHKHIQAGPTHGHAVAALQVKRGRVQNNLDSDSNQGSFSHFIHPDFLGSLFTRDCQGRTQGRHASIGQPHRSVYCVCIISILFDV